MSTPSLRAGVARRDITPKLGTPLFGYPNNRRAESVDDGLNATALFLQSDGCDACIVSLDWCIIDETEVAKLRAEISKQTNLAPENITFHATHTHSGPMTVSCAGWGQVNSAYLDWARPRIIEAVVEAGSTPVPVRVGMGNIETDIGINRRGVGLDGNVSLGDLPWGPCDKTMTVLRFEQAGSTPDGNNFVAEKSEGKPPTTIATIIHVSAHPTSRGDDPAISRDWPGVMMDRVEQLTCAPVVFLNGSFGDVAPYTTIGGVTGDAAKAAREVGLRAAFHAMRVWREIKEFRTLDLQTHNAILPLPLGELPSREEAEKQFAQYAGKKSAPGADGAEWHYWNAVLQALDAPHQTARDWAQTITRLGPIVFVPFAGEIFTEIALRLKHASPFTHTLCLGTSNGAHGYYVTREARARGGYEVWVAKAYNAYALADNLDDFLVQGNLKLLQGL